MIVVVMGVAGTGKTTVGRALAAALGCELLDADDLHPAANVAKLRRGEPLDDADRAPWLAAVAAAIAERRARGADLVVACSALRERYRNALGIDGREVKLVALTAPPEVLAERVRRRAGHMFSPSLLDSQLDTLEPPADAALVVDTTRSVDAVVRDIEEALGRK